VTKPTIATLAAVAHLLASAAAMHAQEPNFGRAVAMTMDELFVGQPVNWYGPGAVYVYRGSGNEAPLAPQVLNAPDSARMDDFGRVLAVDGNTLVIGAPRKRDGTGVVYVYERPTAQAPWAFGHVIEPPKTDVHEEFGTSLSLAGDDLLIGSPAAAGTGRVYQFKREASGWMLRGVLEPPSAAGVRGFGGALARSETRLLIGAPAADSASGRIYAATRAEQGSWGSPRRVALPPTVAASRSGAGSTLLIDGRRAFVGAPDAAAVVVLEEDASGAWHSTETLRPASAPSGSRFGFSLQVVDGEVWVGAPGVQRSNGLVLRFAPADEGWMESGRVDPDDTSGTAWPGSFGYALAAAGDRVALAMPTRDFGEGRVMLLERRGQTWETGPLLEGRIHRIGNALQPEARCREGMMDEFPCTNMELVAHMSVDELGGARGVWVNDVWGWTDPATHRDYALVARRDGISFVEVTDPSAPRLRGNLPRTTGSPPSVWRDVKVIDHFAYVVSDGAGAHGMQVFDLTRLRDVGEESVDFTPDTTYHEIFSAHNVVADTASGFLYIVAANGGGQTCGGGLHMVDARDPLRPAFAGCYHDTASPGSRGYTHDAQCLVYDGPDERYRGRQICVGSNESEINIADVTEKAHPVTVARMSYPNVAYAHQGWFDDEQRYFYMNDELDELAGNVSGTRTIVWDLTELDDPVVANEYIGPVQASDHNLYVVGNRMYQSNYGSGLRVLDISDRTRPREIAFFDSAPYNKDEPGHSAGQSGAWSNYPFFDSGVVIFTSVREGLFIMRVTPPPVS
jgi:choice-of-anchor B domain-containing protein